MVVLATRRDGDRLAGGDLRRVLGHPPGGPARLPAAADDPATPRDGDRPGLRAGRQLGHLRGGASRSCVGFGSSTALAVAPTGSRSPARWRSTRCCSSSSSARLWHRPLWLVDRRRRRVPRRRPRVLRRQPAEDRCTAAGSRSRSPRLVFIVLTTWQRGREIVTRKREPSRRGRCATSSRSSASATRRVARAPGTGVFLNANPETTPLALRANVEHNHVLHETVVILSVETLTSRTSPEDERLTIDDLGYRDDGITHVTGALRLPGRARRPAPARARGARGSRATPTSSTPPTSSRASRSSHGARHAALAQEALHRDRAQRREPGAYFHLPDDRTVVMGSHVTF